MHQNNQDRNPHSEKTATKRAQITIRFDVTEEQASQNYLDAIVGVIRRELKGHEEFAHSGAEVTGKWL